MSLRTYIQGVALVLIVGGLIGCAAEEDTVELHPRPVAGDTVLPIILTGKENRAKGPVLVSAMLQVVGKDGESDGPRLLQMPEVPHEYQPTATLTFYEGDTVLQTMKDVIIVRNC